MKKDSEEEDEKDIEDTPAMKHARRRLDESIGEKAIVDGYTIGNDD
jgi:type III secretory pathway component EscU